MDFKRSPLLAILLFSVLQLCSICNGVHQSNTSTFTETPSLDFSEVTDGGSSTNSIPIQSGSNQDGGKIPLYLGAYFPFSAVWDGSGIIPAVEMALDHINARQDILTDYELRMIYNDTQVRDI